MLLAQLLVLCIRHFPRYNNIQRHIFDNWPPLHTRICQTASPRSKWKPFKNITMPVKGWTTPPIRIVSWQWRVQGKTGNNQILKQARYWYCKEQKSSTWWSRYMHLFTSSSCSRTICYCLQQRTWPAWREKDEGWTMESDWDPKQMSAQKGYRKGEVPEHVSCTEKVYAILERWTNHRETWNYKRSAGPC